MSDFFSEIKYLTLETPEDRPIGRIRKFLINDSYLGFYDEAKKSVWVFTKDGSYINEIIIPEGKGPGELENFEDVILTDQGEIHALGSFKIVVYDITGNFIEETAFDFWIYNFEYLPATGEYVGYTANTMNNSLLNEHTGHQLIYFDKEGTITNSYLPIPGGREEMGYMVPNKFPRFDDQKLFFPHLVDVIYTITDSSVVPRYHLNYGDHSIPEYIFNRRQRYSMAPEGRIEFTREELEANGFVNYLTFYNETDDFIHFQIFAATQPYTILHNKLTSETEVAYGRFTNDIDYGYVPFIYESHDNALYTVIEANDLLHHLNDVYNNEPEKYADPKMSELIELAHSLSANSNPILKIATFKTFDEENDIVQF